VMYASIDDLKSLLSEQELIDLTDDEESGVVNDEIVNKAIEDASAEVDAFLIGRYEVPILPVPKVIRKLCVDIAIYNLFSRRLQDEIPENVRKRYEDAISLLKMIANGQIFLSVSSPEHSASGYVKPAEQVFSRESLKEF